ncbi:hypothetical protein SAMN05216350_105312 [Polaromonas sp. YR568]|uniref:hypothetical protein n=1 Tax=Polaromonas sp. YR568 TaxID=1855301 RepID=UPI0008E1EA96|nr:hypothetical protein [Polaromonas sp. YR568]SFU81339.1 hypothetical protein SAMN05216350_105312 [Polaromonas sp. YR568]
MPIESQDYEEVGFLKYSGEGMQNGVIDAGSAGSALVGLDEALRFFNTRQSPDFAILSYDIPVQTRAGSWEALILAGAAVGGAFALGYAKKAGEKLAENDFKDIGIKHALKKSMSALQWLAKLKKHTRRSRGWQIERIEPVGPIDIAVVINSKGEELPVPLEYMKWFHQMPPRLLLKMTSVIRTDRLLTIGSIDGSKVEQVTIVEEDKHLFENVENEEFEEAVLFPELVDGAWAQLIGRLIRGNEASNTVGLEYQGHVINCVPESGSVRQYKLALFLRCKVEGRVTRHAKNRFVADRRPTLILSGVTPLEVDGQLGLFGG